MISCTMTITGSPKGMAKQHRQFVNEALTALMSGWHREKMPSHFTRAAARRYKYQRRKLRYTRRKAREAPLAGPLEFTGTTKRMMSRAIRVIGKGKKLKGAMTAPRYFYMRKPGHPDKPAEATAVTPAEAQNMARSLAKTVADKLNKLKDKTVVR